MNKLKVVSWNIWQGINLNEVKSLLKEMDADVIALQEVSDDDNGDMAEIIAEHLGYNYVSSLTSEIPKKYLPSFNDDEEGVVMFGNAILTKHQIVHSEAIKCAEEGKKTFMKASVSVGDTVIDFFGLHLKHTHQLNDELQNKQVEKLLDIVSQQKSVVLGDFNALPDSEAIKKVSSSLKNTEAGQQTPTWSVYEKGCSHCLIGEMKHKLDYIFTTNDINTVSFDVIKSNGSDHLPIVATIEI